MANFFNRIGHVEIIAGKKLIFSSKNGGVGATMNIVGKGPTHDTMRSLEGLDFKFSCRKVSDMTTVNSDANVSILGLSRETIQFLATYRPYGIERNAQKRIRVYASYEDFGENLIFDGDIVVAQPSVPPNNWLNVTAFVGNYRKTQLYSGSINGEITIENLMKNVAKELDLEPCYLDRGNEYAEAEKKRRIKGFDCSGTRADLLRMLGRVSDFMVCEDDGALLIKLKDLAKVRPQATVISVISETSGMIGIPEVLIGTNDSTRIDGRAISNIRVKTFINPGVKLWDQVAVESTYLPDMNGTYTVMEIEYSGHLRGQDWYQTMQLTSARIGRA